MWVEDIQTQGYVGIHICDDLDEIDDVEREGGSIDDNVQDNTRERYVLVREENRRRQRGER